MTKKSVAMMLMIAALVLLSIATLRYPQLGTISSSTYVRHNTTTEPPSYMRKTPYHPPLETMGAGESGASSVVTRVIESEPTMTELGYRLAAVLFFVSIIGFLIST